MKKCIISVIQSILVFTHITFTNMKHLWCMILHIHFGILVYMLYLNFFYHFPSKLLSITIQTLDRWSRASYIDSEIAFCTFKSNGIFRNLWQCSQSYHFHIITTNMLLNVSYHSTHNCGLLWKMSMELAIELQMTDIFFHLARSEKSNGTNPGSPPWIIVFWDTSIKFAKVGGIFFFSLKDAYAIYVYIYGQFYFVPFHYFSPCFAISFFRHWGMVKLVGQIQIVEIPWRCVCLDIGLNEPKYPLNLTLAKPSQTLQENTQDWCLTFAEKLGRNSSLKHPPRDSRFWSFVTHSKANIHYDL